MGLNVFIGNIKVRQLSRGALTHAHIVWRLPGKCDPLTLSLLLGNTRLLPLEGTSESQWGPGVLAQAGQPRGGGGRSAPASIPGGEREAGCEPAPLCDSQLAGGASTLAQGFRAPWSSGPVAWGQWRGGSPWPEPEADQEAEGGLGPLVPSRTRLGPGALCQAHSPGPHPLPMAGPGLQHTALETLQTAEARGQCGHPGWPRSSVPLPRRPPCLSSSDRAPVSSLA